MMKNKIRRTLSVILVLALFAAFLPQAVASAKTPRLPRGDLTGDGVVHAHDARFALQLAAHLVAVTDGALHFGDIDADGKITSHDARRILRAAAKLEELPPWEETPDITVVYGEFASKLLKTQYARERADGGYKNVMISPLSVMTALAMAENGASENTLKQIEQMFGVSVSELNEILSDYVKNLPQTEKSRLVAANSVWIRDGAFDGIVKDFLDDNKEYYDAEVREEPFNDKTLADVNGWCDEHTDGMIKEILDRIDPFDVMYLINALTFDAEWAQPFETDEGMKREFTNADGTKTTVQMMHGDETTLLETEKAEGFAKAYAGGKYQFAALLPKEGTTVDDLIADMDESTVSGLFANAAAPDYQLRIALPKFETEYDCSMVETLKTLGMTDAFSGDAADFSGIGRLKDGNNVYISDVIHKTFISVDDLGTRAAAVTAIVAKANAVMKSRTIVFDRPFVYMIVDSASCLPVFIGVMNQMGK